MPGENQYRRADPFDRFWSKVAIPADVITGCWTWTASLDPNGYGQFYVGGTRVIRKAHQISFESIVGPTPDGLELDHVCENERCVNPAHLEPVTHAENCRRFGERSKSCRRGHPWTLESTIWRAEGDGRECRICRNAGKRAAYSRSRS